MNKQLKKSIDKILDKKADSLSGEICSKLNQSRQLALSHSLKSKFNPLFWVAPLAASLILSVYFISSMINTNIPDNSDDPLSNNYTLAEDMDVSEDLEFYLWLAQEESINI